MVETMRLTPLLLLLGCKGSSSNSNNGSGETGPYVSIETQTVTTDSDGIATVDITMEKGESAFMVTGIKAASGLTGLEYIDGPGGDTALHWQDWWDSAESLTYAFYPADNSTVNWPVREEDGPLDEGTWSVSLGAYNNQYSYLSDEDIELTIHRKWDPDLTEGTVKVVIIYAEGLQDESDLTEAVAYAVEELSLIHI